MGKRVSNVTWRTVALEGVPLDGAALDGFIGLEECTDYGLDSKIEKKRKKKGQKKPKEIQKGPMCNSESQDLKNNKHKSAKNTQESAIKKIKLSNGFVVETCTKIKPSTDTGIHMLGSKKDLSKNNGINNNDENGANETTGQKLKFEDAKKSASKKKGKKENSSLEENEANEEKLGLDDMHAWSQFQVPDEILRALAEQGFDKPTKIQELCLPPAMLGRRDILGAAETGSGKTLAFGIPILSGIMKLKEKELAGIDVYDLQYKKTSVKRDKAKTEEMKTERKKKYVKVRNVRNKNKTVENAIETGEESDEEADQNHEDNSDKEIEMDDDKSDDKIKETNEIQDDSNDGIHLSEMFDSDDLADSSDEETDKIIDPRDSDDDIDKNDASDSDDVESGEEEVDAEQVGDGIGCVKVIDNIELPAPNMMKTGKPLYALIITPTRELAMQISRHLISAAKYTGIRVATLVGGMAQVKQERLLAGAPEVVVCTPGRLWEMLQQGNPHLRQVDNIKFLAIDETDRMVERNHFEELKPLLERLNADERRRGNRQNFVMSATLTMTHDLPSHLKGKKVTKRGKILNSKVQKMTPQQKTKKLITLLGMTDPKIVDLTADNHGTAGTLTECRISCALDHKDYYLFYVLRTHPGRTIVFCNSIGCVKRLAQLFALLKCRPLPLHAGMPQRQRLKNLERFRDDARGVLVATDVAARGLDIPNVDHVIHYQVPRTAENYVHRSGRTARANKEGLTILMMEPGEAFLYSKLCRTLNKGTELAEFPVPDHVLASMKECVSLARDVEGAALAGKRRAQEAGWLERAARDCDLIVDDYFVPMKKKLDNQQLEPMAKTLQLKKKQLDTMLSKPIFPRGFSYKYPSLNDSNALVVQSEENALQAMKRVLETGAMKRDKRKSKNAPLLNLEQKSVQKSKKLSKKSGKVEKKKKKFFKKST